MDTGKLIAETSEFIESVNPVQATSSQLREMRELFEDQSGIGLWLFAYWICGCKDITARLHMEECQLLSKWGSFRLPDDTWHNRPVEDHEEPTHNYRRIHMCVPRDTFKTTVGTRANGLRVVLMDPEATLAIFNESEANAKSWVGAMKNVIEGSKLLQVLWPEVLPPGIHFEDTRSIPRSWKWGDTGFKLVRESYITSEMTVTPFGIGGSATGNHYSHKILDDIIGEKSADSEAIMRDAIDWVDHARALEKPADRGNELVNYTRWAYFDVYRHQLEKWPGEYVVYHRSLLEDENRAPDVLDGTSIFPERFPTELCRKMYDTDPFVFMSQRQCIPQAGRDTSFDKAWIQNGYVELEETRDMFVIPKDVFDPARVHADLQDQGIMAPSRVPLSLMHKAIILDPAPSPGSSEARQNRNARNGLAVVGIDPWGRYFLLEAAGLRLDPVDILHTIVRMGLRWGTTVVGIEEVNFSKVYAPLWTALLHHEYPDVHIDFVPLLTKNKDKDTRIKYLIPQMRQRMWHINEDETKHAVMEFLEYPHSQTRDIIDAIAYTDQILIRPQTFEERYEQRRQRAREDDGRDPHTHY